MCICSNASNYDYDYMSDYVSDYNCSNWADWNSLTCNKVVTLELIHNDAAVKWLWKNKKEEITNFSAWDL